MNERGEAIQRLAVALLKLAAKSNAPITSDEAIAMATEAVDALLSKNGGQHGS